MISPETALFLSMTVCGVAISVLFDFMRALRGAAKAGAVLTAVTDVIFAFTSFVIAAWCIQYFGNGRLRVYEAIGIALGMAFYFTVLSGILYRFFLYCIKKFLRITSFIFKILLTPLLFLYKILIVPVQKRVGSIIQRSRNSNAKQNKKPAHRIRYRPQKRARRRFICGICRHDAFKRGHAISENKRAKKGNSTVKRSA